MIWTDDLANDARVAKWPALLRSQQQHAIMCASHNNQRSQHQLAQMEQALQRSERKSESLQERLEQQHEDLAALRDQLRDSQSRLREQDSSHSEGAAEVGRLRAEIERLRGERARHSEDAASNTQAMQDTIQDQARELVRLREAAAATGYSNSAERDALAEQQRSKIASLQTEVQHVSEEANRKIDAANERIRALRKDRDDAIKESQRLGAEKTQLIE